MAYIARGDTSLTRKSKLLLNGLTSMTYQVVVILCGFILPRLYLVFFGSAANGLVNSITNFLGFISLAECGVGAVVESAFYQPLSDRNSRGISAIFRSSSRFFHKIGFILLIYVTCLIIVYPIIVSDRFGFVYTALLILAISINSFSQYFLGITYNLLLNADQYGFVVNLTNIIAMLINTAISAFLMYAGADIQVVKLCSSLVFLCRPLALKIYVEKKYYIDRHICYDEEPIKQKWNGLAQHVASVVLNKTDVVVLTLFSSLENVSIYTVYHLVVAGLMELVQAVVNGAQALFGNLLANKEYDKLTEVFEKVEWLIHTGTTLAFTMAGVLIVPFVNVYTKGISDVNYLLPGFAAAITLSQAMRSLRLPYLLMILAAGHYKQTQWSSVIEALINVIISVCVVARYGLVGVAVGTFLAMAYRSGYLVWYLSKNILNRPIKYFVRHCVVDVITCAIMIQSTKMFVVMPDGYVQWVILAIKIGIICLLECVVINGIAYNKKIRESLKWK